jgi:hypothetical protein
MRRFTALCAAAGIALSALVVVSPAQAAFHLIRWDGTGICQVWDDSLPTRPWPSDYRNVSRPHASLSTVLAIKGSMLKRGRCSL